MTARDFIFGLRLKTSWISQSLPYRVRGFVFSFSILPLKGFLSIDWGAASHF